MTGKHLHINMIILSSTLSIFSSLAYLGQDKNIHNFFNSFESTDRTRSWQENTCISTWSYSPLINDRNENRATHVTCTFIKFRLLPFSHIQLSIYKMFTYKSNGHSHISIFWIAKYCIGNSCRCKNFKRNFEKPQKAENW